MFKWLLKRKESPKLSEPEIEIYEPKAYRDKGHFLAKINDDGIHVFLKHCDEKGNICDDGTTIQILRTKIDEFCRRHHAA